MESRSSDDIYAATLAVFDRQEGYEPLTTPEVADALDVSRRTVYNRLTTLVERDQIETKETGANSRIWWRPPADSGSTPSESGTETHGTGDSSRHGQATPTSQDSHSSQPQERHLSKGEYVEIFEKVPDGVALHHPDDGSIVDANQKYCDMLGYTQAELVEVGFEEIHPEVSPYTSERAAEYIEKAQNEGPQTVEWLDETKDGRQLPVEVHLRQTKIDGQDRILAVVRDITERKNRERELAETANQLQGILDAVEVGIALRNPEGEYLLANHKFQEAILGAYEHELGDTEDIVGLSNDDFFPEEVAERIRDEDRTVLEHNETVRRENSLQLPYGKRTFLTRKSPLFDTEGNLYAVCSVSTDITEQKIRERKLEQKRQELEAINDLNDVVRGITDAVIEQSTRQNIEQVVCDRLAASESYEHASICAVDPETNSVRGRAVAGGADFSDDVQNLLALDTVDDREMQVHRNIRETSSSDSLREHACEHGYRSTAAIPICHKSSLYGVIGLFSERTDAFAQRERAVIEQLGEVVGHAIAAVDRKRALLGDEVMELVVRLHGANDLDIPIPEDESVVLDRVVPVGDGEFLEYGTATGDAIETIKALVEVESTSHFGPVRIIDTNGDETRFEARLKEPSIVRKAMEYDGYVHQARLEDQQYDLLIHLPPGTDVRRFIEDATEERHGAELVARRQRSRPNPTPTQMMQALQHRLTERQRAVVEAGYFAGFFDFPRESSGEEVAESLGINSSTFHQHVRKAEKALLDTVFTE